MKLLSQRRVVRVLKKLLPLFEARGDLIDMTYEELATHLGYRNRSGCFKTIKILESLGVVKRTTDGYLQLTMDGVILE